MNTADKVVQLIDCVAEFTKRASAEREKRARRQAELKKKAAAVAASLAENGHIEPYEKEAAVSALMDHQKALTLVERLSRTQMQQEVNLGTPVAQKTASDNARKTLEEADRRFREALIGSAAAVGRI